GQRSTIRDRGVGFRCCRCEARVARAEFLQVESGAEGRVLPGEYQDVDVLGCLCVGDRSAQVTNEPTRKSVTGLGPVEGDGGDALGVIDEDEVGVGHGVSPVVVGSSFEGGWPRWSMAASRTERSSTPWRRVAMRRPG